MKTFEAQASILVSENRRLAPSKNGRFVLSREYRDAKTALITIFRAAANMQKWETIEGEFCVRLEVWTRKDGTNTIKPIVDALQEAGVVKNDRNLRGLILSKHPAHGVESLRVRVREIK